MIQQLKDGDLLSVVGDLRNVLAHVIVDGKFALLLEQENAGGGKLFGSGTDVENRIRSDGDVLLDVRQAVAFRIDELAIARDGQSATGRTGFGVIGKQRVDFGRRRILREESRRKRKQAYDKKGGAE